MSPGPSRAHARRVPQARALQAVACAVMIVMACCLASACQLGAAQRSSQTTEPAVPRQAAAAPRSEASPAVGGVAAASVESRDVTAVRVSSPAVATPNAFVLGNVEYILLHEIAHLLIRDLDIPVIGPEESAADYIASAVLIRAELFDDVRAARARQFLLATANGLATSWEYSARSGDEVRYWDSHALTIQRFYQIICLVYGSDAERFAALPERVGMPPARAARCADEFARAARSLAWLLESYGRRPGDPEPAAVEVVFDRAPTLASTRVVEDIKASGLLENTLRRLNERFTIREPFRIHFRGCGQAQAAWLPEQREIVFCYELLDSYQLLSQSPAARDRLLGLDRDAP